MPIYKVYSIGRTWSWPVMSAAAYYRCNVLYSTVLYFTILYRPIHRYPLKMRKFADTMEQTDNQTDRQTVQRLRPLYPLRILEGVGQ